MVIPSKHAGSDPEAFWLRPVVAVTANVQPESGRIVLAVSDFPHPFQFRFSKEGMDRIAQNRPGSHLDGLVRVWPNASTQEAAGEHESSGPVSGRTQPARYQFPSFRLGCVLPDVPDKTVQNQPGSDLALVDCVRFCPNGSGPEQADVQELSGPLLAIASQPIRTVCESDPASLLGIYLSLSLCHMPVYVCMHVCCCFCGNGRCLLCADRALFCDPMGIMAVVVFAVLVVRSINFHHDVSLKLF